MGNKKHVCVMVVALFLGGCANKELNLSNVYKKYETGIYDNGKRVFEIDVQNEILNVARDSFAKIDSSVFRQNNFYEIVIGREESGRNVADSSAASALSFDSDFSHVISYVVTQLFRGKLKVSTKSAAQKEVIDSIVSSVGIKTYEAFLNGKVQEVEMLENKLNLICYWTVNSTVGKEETVYFSSRGYSPFGEVGSFNVGLDKDTGKEITQFPVYASLVDCTGEAISSPDKMLIQVVKSTKNDSVYFLSRQLGLFWRDVENVSATLNQGKDSAVALMIVKMFSEVLDVDFDGIVMDAINRRKVKYVQELINKANVGFVEVKGKRYWEVPVTGIRDDVTSAFIEKYISTYAANIHGNDLEQLGENIKAHIQTLQKRKVFTIN